MLSGWSSAVFREPRVPGSQIKKKETPYTPCMVYMPISWGGLGGQCGHIFHTWSVWEQHTSAQHSFAQTFHSSRLDGDSLHSPALAAPTRSRAIFALLKLSRLGRALSGATAGNSGRSGATPGGRGGLWGALWSWGGLDMGFLTSFSGGQGAIHGGSRTGCPISLNMDVLWVARTPHRLLIGGE